jgi:hypothetical protein
MHLSEDVLQAHMDRELSEQESEATRQHLEKCMSCKELFSSIQQSQSEIQTRLNTLVPDEDDLPEPHVLLEKVNTSSPQTLARKIRWKPAWAAVIATCALAAALYLEPVRVWATEFLSLFRVQRITVVRIDPANIQQLEEGLFGRESQRRMEQFLSDNAHVTKHGERKTVQNANEAARLAGFGVRMPTKLETPSRIHVQPAVDASFEIDVEELQNVLDDAGRSDVRIPEDLDGKTIQFNIPASVTALFGKCPDPEEVRDRTSRRQKARQYAECKIFIQMPTPVVVAPPSLNAAELGTEMLKLFGFTDDQAREFSKSIDWTTTLVVPLPLHDTMNVAEVDVDGVKGQLFSSQHPRLEISDAYNLLWIRDGHLYSLMGRGTADEAIAIANSL